MARNAINDLHGDDGCSPRSAFGWATVNNFHKRKAWETSPLVVVIPSGILTEQREIGGAIKPIREE
jgi:hypothetical protein